MCSSFQRLGEPPQCHVLLGVFGAHVCLCCANPGLEAVFHTQQSHSWHKVYRWLTSKFSAFRGSWLIFLKLRFGEILYCQVRDHVDCSCNFESIMCKLLYMWDNPGLYWWGLWICTAWFKSYCCADVWYQIDDYQTFKVHKNKNKKTIYIKTRGALHNDHLFHLKLGYHTFIFVDSFKCWILKAHWCACNYALTIYNCLILSKHSLVSWTKS